METKQVIVIRKDLKMRRGKEIAQGAHAAMMWLVERLHPYFPGRPDLGGMLGGFSSAELAWMDGSFTKVTCQVSSLDELEAVARKAEEAGVMCYVVQDAGFTEFGGIPTVTALAVGPDTVENVDKVTKDLQLY
jgi:peptidyl-tRNA hydrolase, PTH2 family